MQLIQSLLKRKLALTAILVLWTVLAVESWNYRPILAGNAADFWTTACGVQTQAFNRKLPLSYGVSLTPAQGDWYLYYFRGHHQISLAKVNKQAVEQQLDEVLTLLDKPIVEPVKPSVDWSGPYKLMNERRLKCLSFKHQTNGQHNSFLAHINDMASLPEPASQKSNHTLAVVHDQWVRGQRYWMAILFEALFLPFWWLFSFHGGIFGKYNQLATTRMAWSPLILLTPYYLGYTPFLFFVSIKSAIVYPWLAKFGITVFGWTGLNSIDTMILHFLPKPLMLIYQGPLLPTKFDFHAQVSPTLLVGFAILVLGLAWSYRKLTRTPRASR